MYHQVTDKCRRLIRTYEMKRENDVINSKNLQGRPKNRDHFVFRLVNSEILIRSASNLALIKVILFLILIRNLFESTLENKVAPSSE